MRKIHGFGFAGVIALMLIGAVAGSFGNQSTTGPFSFRRTSSAPQPSVTDVTECNEYAHWIAARETAPESAADQGADERLLHGALLNTGTLEGLAESNQENALAKDAYRRCMVRRGYKAWG